MKAERETDIVRACLQLLALRGVYAWRQNQGAVKQGRRLIRFTRGVEGISDIIGVMPGGRMPCGHGVFFACEVKRPGRKMSKEQSHFLDTIRANGGVALCVSDIKELDLALSRLGIT